MGIIRWIRDFLMYVPEPAGPWFEVEFDETTIHMRCAIGRKPWAQSVEWSDVVRVCFKPEPLGVSDGIYIWSSKRPESYAVPLDAAGGEALWNEIVKRRLFDSALAIDAMTMTVGAACWPPELDSGSEDE